jgi:hypothetical protein
MAGERPGIVPKEVKKAGYWLGENSIWISAPATVIFVASGGVAPLAGAVMLGADVLLSHEAGRRRRALG